MRRNCATTARVLEDLDRERVTVAASLGLRGRTGLEWLKLAYDADGTDLNEAIHNQPGYYGGRVRGHAQTDRTGGISSSPQRQIPFALTQIDYEPISVMLPAAVLYGAVMESR